MTDRRLQARQIRHDAAEIAFLREHPAHTSNGEELKYRDSKNNLTHIANFTKGLPHNLKTGSIEDPADFQQFVRGIDSGDPRDFRETPLGPPGEDGVAFPTWQSPIAAKNKVSVRAWESQGAGLTFDLEGPDAQALTMPPAPTLDSQELVTEMIEVYSMALLRDVPFSTFSTAPGVKTAIERLNQSAWIAKADCCDLTSAERRRQRQPFSTKTVFRGVTPGDDVGPYVSQFLLVGNPGIGNRPPSPQQGLIRYGALTVDQRVRVAEPLKDYMTTWDEWIDVQNGANVSGLETYSDDPAYRLIATPRDLATYVHFDALYEAYLNACLILLGMGAPFDPGIPFQLPDYIDKQQGFAHFGGPHILSLLTEVATRALKAVRFQKFNVHRRLRPEAVGGWVHRYCIGQTQNLEVLETLVKGLGDDLLKAVYEHNQQQNPQKVASFLLPMAFPEGSPMHPSYGAGHATVAGACVTILKAFFDHSWKLPFCFQAVLDDPKNPASKSSLVPVSLAQPLTVEGELNKVASNISIGRNWAGVHYFTDYIESLRLGENIALGILEEQKLTYGENFSMTVPLFDGGTRRI